MSDIGDTLRLYAAIADEHEEFTVVAALVGPPSSRVGVMLHACMKDHHIAAGSLADDLFRIAEAYREAHARLE